MEREIRILADGAAIARRAAGEFVQAADAAVREKNSFNVVLAGGSTPKTLYGLLATDPALRSQVPWDKMHLFFGDERHVGPDHPDSNFRMATEAMLSKVPLKSDHLTRIKGEYPDTEQAAQEYEQILRAFFKLEAGEYPRFDLVLAGMGSEGHTLSLFPGTKALHAGGRIAVRNWVGKLYTERITLTAPAVNHAARILFMVTGADKAPALKAVLEGPFEPEQLPAQLLQPKNGKLLWLVDAAAGSMLSSGIRRIGAAAPACRNRVQRFIISSRPPRKPWLLSLRTVAQAFWPEASVHITQISSLGARRENGNHRNNGQDRNLSWRKGRIALGIQVPKNFKGAPAYSRPGLHRSHLRRLRPQQPRAGQSPAHVRQVAASAAPAIFRILPVDQGIEHSGGASFAKNPDYFDPENIVKLAIEGGCNAVASTFGVLGSVARKYAHKIPFIVKINHNELLTFPNKL